MTAYRFLPCLFVLAHPWLAGIAVSSPPAAPAPRGYVCLKAAAAPKIEGKLDDEAWKAAPWSDAFVDIEGDKQSAPRYRTRVKMLWDDKAIYIAAEIEEPHVWATLKEHDAVIFRDPDFEVFIDPDGDNHLYGELELNALNTTWDLLLNRPYKDGGHALNGWEIIGLRTGVQVQGTINDPTDTDKGWTVEIAWPWDGLKEMTHGATPPKDGDQWRINVSRVEWDVTVENGQYVKVKDKPEHNWVWSPQGVIDMHRPERWGYLQFSEQAVGPVKYRPNPDQGVKDLLHEIYCAQREYHKKHGKFTSDLAELGIAKSELGTPEIQLTPRGFEATLKSAAAPDAKLWGITSDALLWSR